MKLGDQPPKAGTVRGVLLATEQNGSGSVVVPMEIAAALAAAGSPAPAGRTPRRTGSGRREDRQSRCRFCFCSRFSAA